MIKSLKDLLDKFSRFTNSLVYDGGICKRLLDIDFNSLDWYDLASFELVNNTVKIKAKNYAFYKEFYCLNIIELPN